MTIAALFASCSTTKNAQTTKISSTPQQEQKQNKSLDYIRKVGDQAVYAQNIVSKINFTIDAMGRDVSVDGKLNMRRNECIRITLVPFGLMEVGRLEFTPDYVLIMDRMHKEYVKASYGLQRYKQDNMFRKIPLLFCIYAILLIHFLLLPNIQTVSYLLFLAMSFHQAIHSFLQLRMRPYFLL